MSRIIRVATRSSALAIAQTSLVVERLKEKNPQVEFELVPLTTEGDRRLDKSLADFGGKGVFIKELEVALLEKRAHIAVHSLKDMPSEVLPEFCLAAVCKREDPRDAFVGRTSAKFMGLAHGARVGTGSIRRIVQLRQLRPDVEFVPIRGNLQTRLKKMEEGDVAKNMAPLDGIVLAAAGLKRMGLWERATDLFEVDDVLPASGQGILAIETLSSVEPEIKEIVDKVNDVKTYGIAIAEMSFLSYLNAGCQFPVASFASWSHNGQDHCLCISGIYFDEAHHKLLKVYEKSIFNFNQSTENFVEQARQLGFKLGKKIKDLL
ncbi:MAG: hydroxymethylbilane synthase [Fibrobacteraceae bacterium]|nr:hydroxymethylbilane synthase [Fibrobacteraceae bacterium]